MDLKHTYPYFLIILVILLFSCTGNQGSSTTGNGPVKSDGTSSSTNGPSLTTDTDPESTGGGIESERLLAEINRGYEVWREAGCVDCHRIGDDPGGNTGPALTGIGDRLSREEIAELILDPGSVHPETVMPPQEIDSIDLEYLTAFLSVLSSDTAVAQ